MIPSFKLNILGTDYTIHLKSKADDPMFDRCDGYCDKTSKTIAVVFDDPDTDLDDYGVYARKSLRHEIIHAALFESGLHGNWKHDEWGHDETTIDWFANQFPKLVELFREARCLA